MNITSEENKTDTKSEKPWIFDNMPDEVYQKALKIAEQLPEKQQTDFMWKSIFYNDAHTTAFAKTFLDEVEVQHDALSGIELLEVAWKNGWRSSDLQSYKGFSIEASYCPEHYPNPIFPQSSKHSIYYMIRRTKRYSGNRYYTTTFADAKEFINRCKKGKSVKSLIFKENNYIDRRKAHIMANGVWSEYEE